MHLSKKPKIFSEFFTALLKFTFNFEHFEKKYESHSLCNCEVRDGEGRGYVNV